MNMSNIPGWFSGSEQREIIKLLYKYNHPDTIGVEVGCLHGRSSYVISATINKGKLFCIDLWNNMDTYNSSYTEDQIKKYNLPYKGLVNTLEVFLENTKDRKNIIHIKGSSPDIVKDWNKPIDFIFLDAAHTNPGDRENIDFWLPKIKPGGTFLGHDCYFDRRFPDVNLNVEHMEDLLKQKVILIPNTSIWYFTLPKN